MLATGALAAPAVAGEDELRVFEIGRTEVIGDGGGLGPFWCGICPPNNSGPGYFVAVPVVYDCRTNDEQSGKKQRFAVGIVVGQGTHADPDAEASGVRTADCDASSDRDRLEVLAEANPGSAQFKDGEPTYVDAVGATYLPRTNDLTDLDFRAFTDKPPFSLPSG